MTPMFTLATSLWCFACVFFLLSATFDLSATLQTCRYDDPSTSYRPDVRRAYLRARLWGRVAKYTAMLALAVTVAAGVVQCVGGA